MDVNCKNCGYKYCAFRGVDREILAYLCEDFEAAKKWENKNDN